MDNKDDIIDVDSAEQRLAMRRRHSQLALQMQEIAMCGLAELRRRGDLTVDGCAELLDTGMKLENAAGAHSRKRH